MRVLRDSENNLLKVDDVFYQLSTLVDCVFEIVKQRSDNPAFDMPGWFYSGSPYADEIHKLGVKPVNAPNKFTPEFTPLLGNIWRTREPMWPSIFNCEIKE
jgi:hypothetical protein